MPDNEPAERADWDLAGAAAQGDEAAYEALIAKYQSAIHHFIFRSVRDEETARDLAQEVFVKAWFALPKLLPRGKFSTWLFQIAVNLCRDYAKSKAAKQLRRTHSLTRDEIGELVGDREFPHPGLSPDRSAENAEAMAALDEAIRSLPEKLREPFVLCAIEGHSLKDVSAILGSSAKAIEVRVYRARQALLKRVEHLKSLF